MTDKELIDRVGGPTRFAVLLGLHAKGAVQRVSNWRVRGIPPRIRLDHASVFARLEAADGAPEATAGTEGAPPVSRAA